MPGRPTKLTRKMCQTLIRHIEVGCTYIVACGACGVSYTTFKRWMVEGRDPANKRQRAFRAAIKRAKHTLEVNCLTRIDLASIEPKQWQAAAWLLQHRVGGAYLQSAKAIYKPEVSVTLSDIARDLETNGDGEYYRENGVADAVEGRMVGDIPE